MILLTVFFFLSIIFSFLCSIWEAVLLSITPSYVSRQEQEGSSIANLLKEYKKDIDRPLSAILTLNTIAHTVGAIGVGAQAGAVFGENDFYGLSYESIIAGLMTLAILILSEIIPKTIGANNWKSLAPFTLKSIKFLLWILAPLVWVSQLITKSMKNEKGKSVLSRADFSAMTSVAEQSGEIQKSESRIIKNLIHLNELVVKDIMTPRTVVKMADETLTVRAFFNENENLNFSRIPIYKDKEDFITGMVLKDDILKALAQDNDDITLSSLKIDVNIVKDDLALPSLFDKLVAEKTHLVVVVDSYGSLVGIVSMEDMLETILGLEITDESDKVANLQSLARKNWEERAKKLGLIE